MKTLEICVATMKPGLVVECLLSSCGPHAETRPFVTIFSNACDVEVPDEVAAPFADVQILSSPENVGVVKAYDACYRAARGDALLFIHDDVEISEPGWDRRLLSLFTVQPAAAVAGFGGAPGLGNPDMYVKEYLITHLHRHGFRSNMRDWRVHGEHATEDQRIMTLDGFSIAVRRDFLDTIDGWNWWPTPHHGYDSAMCCMAARHLREVWLVPVACHHRGGQTAVSAPYIEWANTHHGSDGQIHADAHRLLYDMFRDVLPLVTPSTKQEIPEEPLQTVSVSTSPLPKKQKPRRVHWPRGEKRDRR